MKKSNSRFKGTVRPIICSIVSALALIGDSAYAQFAQIPLHLQNKTVTTTGDGVKPNVMLFIDDSGSMKDTPAGRKLNNTQDYYHYNYYNDNYYNNYVRDYYDDDDGYYSRYGAGYYDPFYGAYSSGSPNYYSSSRRSSSQQGSRSTVDRNFANQRDNESKLDITKKALFAILQHYNNRINWGLQTLHNNGKSDLTGYSDDWRHVQRQVQLIKADSGTPTTRRYYEISDIVKNNTLYRCQKNYIVLMSDGDANTSCGYERNAKNPPFNYNGDAYFGFPKDFSNGCNRQKDNDKYHIFWDQNDGLRFFSQTFATKDFKTGGFDKTGKSWDGADIDFKDKKTGKSIYANQIAETFTVGFGTAISQRGETYLRSGASKPEYYYNAKNTNDLINAFAKIFESIEAESLNQPIEIEGSVAPAVTGNKVPNMAAIVQLDTGSWSSQLQFFDVNPDGKINASLKPKNPSFADRKTLINTGEGVYWIKDLQKDNAYFGIERGSAVDDKEWKDALIPWVAARPEQSDEAIKTLAQNKKYSQAYRVRAQGQEIGDILDSPVAAIGKERYGRQAFLVTAANDGMAHIFVSQDDKEHPYKLELSYIPAAMEQDGSNTLAKGLKYLANEKYGQTVPHRHMINGGFVLRRTASHNGTDENQQIFMFGSMGQGGRGAYALNIGGINRITRKPTGVRSDDPKTDVPLFETKKGTVNELGYTVGSPQIGRVSIQRNANTAAVDISKNIRYAGFLASGYSSSKWKKVDNPKSDEKKQETALYIYDILGQEANVGTKTGNPGELLRKISVAEGVGGLSSPTLVDVDFDGIIDIAYAGDYGGNMYRFDFRKEDPNKWSYQRIYEGNDKQPITSAPAVSRRGTEKYVVIFGTGSDIYQEDLEDKNQQAVYGIFDDVSPTKNGSTNVTAATDKDLQTQTISSRTIDGQEYRFLSNNAISPNHKGWKVDLASNGERVVIKPTMILRTAVVSTRIYDAAKTDNFEGDLCVRQSSNKISSSSWVFGLNAETGGALRKSDAHLVFKNNPMNGEFYANGRKSSGLLNFTYVDTAKGDDNPVTVDGDSGGTGTDRMITTMPFIPQNKCFVDKASRTLITNKKESIGVEGRICGLRRISWREIFN